MLSVSCRSDSNRSWPELPDSAEAICDTLENLYLHDLTRTQGKQLMNRLDSLTPKDASPSARARVLYWKSVVASPHSDSGRLLIKEARNMTDSARYPYMYARIIMEDDYFDRNTYLRRHNELRNNTIYFAGRNEPMMEIFSCRVLSSFYLHIGDYEAFHRCADEIADLCNEIGNDTLIAKNRINYVMSYTHMGDTVKARSILKELLKNPCIASDSDFMGRLYVNLANLTSNAENYRKAMDISPSFRSSPDIRNTLLFVMMKTDESNGDVRRADSLLSVLRPLVERDDDNEARGIMHSMLSRQARERGDFKTALDEIEISKRYYDSTFTTDHRMTLTQNTFKDEIARQELQYEQDRQLAATRLLASCIVFILCCSLIWLYFKGQRNRMKMKQLASEAEVAKLNLDLEKEKRTIAAMGLSMTERDNLIKDMLKIADKLHDDGAISSDAKQTIGKMVKLSQLSQQEWDNFQIAYSRVHPHFLSRLKENYPALSEGDTRLALYIRWSNIKTDCSGHASTAGFGKKESAETSPEDESHTRHIPGRSIKRIIITMRKQHMPH